MTTETGKLWCIHIPGPDDLYAAPSHEMAEHMAACHNAAMNQYLDANPGLRERWETPKGTVFAEVCEWEHGADEHAEELADFDPSEWTLDEGPKPTATHPETQDAP